MSTFPFFNHNEANGTRIGLRSSGIQAGSTNIPVNNNQANKTFANSSMAVKSVAGTRRTLQDIGNNQTARVNNPSISGTHAGKRSASKKVETKQLATRLRDAATITSQSNKGSLTSAVGNLLSNVSNKLSMKPNTAAATSKNRDAAAAAAATAVNTEQHNIQASKIQSKQQPQQPKQHQHHQYEDVNTAFKYEERDGNGQFMDTSDSYTKSSSSSSSSTISSALTASSSSSSSAPVADTLAQTTSSFSESLTSQVIPDIDSINELNPLYVTELIKDIFTNLKTLEAVYCINPGYMALQPEFTTSMRETVLSWMIEIHHTFNLLQETLFLAVNIFDRFCQLRQVPRNIIQLAAATSLLIAAKYEEIIVPTVGDFIYMTSNTYANHEVLWMEREILGALEFNLGCPSVTQFLRRFHQAAACDTWVYFLALYQSELAIIRFGMVKYLPSVMAAASLYVARRIATPDVESWNMALEHYTGYTESELMPCIKDCVDLLVQAPQHKHSEITYKKYRLSENFKVSKVAERVPLEEVVPTVYANQQ